MNFFFVLVLMPQPASFSLEFDANPHAEYSVEFEGTPLRQRHTYRSEPLIADTEVELTVRVTAGDRVSVSTVKFTVSPGYHRTFTVTIPRVYPHPGLFAGWLKQKTIVPV